MENSYGIGITNRFDLFLDEGDDPLEVLKFHEQEKEAKKKTKISEKENKGKPESKVKPAPNERKGIKETQNVKSQSVGKPKEGLKGKEPRVGGPRPDGPRPPRGDRPVGDRPERNDRTVKFSSESREERNNRQNREDRPYNQSGGDFFSRDREPGIRNDGDRAPRGRGGMGRGMGRGMRGGRGGYDNRGKREFDRQSGSDKTGVKAVDKRDGGGAHNWGSHRDDIEELDSSVTENQEWTPEKPDDATTIEPAAELKEGEADPAPAETGEDATPAEEEPQELTLDEWKALQKSRAKPQYNLRKAGEGEDLTQWKKMYALDKKKAELENEEEEEEEYDASEYPQRVGRLKHVLDIEVVFGDTRRGGRGRGRGGPRGMGRGRGGESRGPPREREFDPAGGSPRGGGMGGGPGGPGVGGMGGLPGPGPVVGAPRRDFNKPHARPPKVDDEKDFPSLG